MFSWPLVALHLTGPARCILVIVGILERHAECGAKWLAVELILRRHRAHHSLGTALRHLALAHGKWSQINGLWLSESGQLANLDWLVKLKKGSPLYLAEQFRHPSLR